MIEQIVEFKAKKTIPLILNDFLEQTFQKLTNEFEMYLNFFPYQSEDIYKAEERTLLGLFNNAVIRTSKDHQTYQEYGVYDSVHKYYGRSDMFVMTPSFQVLIEVKKMKSATLDFSNRELSQILSEVWQQGLKYYQAEITNLTKEPYLMSLVFDYYKMKSQAKDLSKLREYDIDNTRDGVDYFTAYKLDNYVLMAYGRIC